LSKNRTIKLYPNQQLSWCYRTVIARAKQLIVKKRVDFMAIEYQRMMDGSHAPDEKEITEFIGEPANGAWMKLRQFLRENYDIVPEMMFDKKHGWDVRYRKSGKTLVALTPEKGAVRVLIVLGREESEKALSMRKELSPKMYRLIENTKQLHDGRWLWARLLQTKDAEDIEKLLPIKRKPKKPTPKSSVLRE
jgi:hypothetical protein